MAIVRMKFHVALTTTSLKRLNQHAEAELKREREWIAERRRERLTSDMPRRAAAAVRREIRAEAALMRREGIFGGTRDDLVTRAVREELRARGLDRDWPEPPAGAVDAPGRRWGTPASQPWKTGGYSGRVTVNLPHDLGETVRRAAYWTSEEAAEALQEWADFWGDGPEAAARKAEREGLPEELVLLATEGHPSAPQSALEIRDRLRQRILTTGHILRASIDRLPECAQPETPGASDF
ncbi:hypothetical protein [Streptomyces sp. NPDC055607]